MAKCVDFFILCVGVSWSRAKKGLESNHAGDLVQCRFKGSCVHRDSTNVCRQQPSRRGDSSNGVFKNSIWNGETVNCIGVHHRNCKKSDVCGGIDCKARTQTNPAPSYLKRV